mgnify:CR=1 FL=1
MVELEVLPSVGEKTAEKLRDAGFADMMRLATATPKELSVKAEIGEGVAERQKARNKAKMQGGCSLGCGQEPVRLIYANPTFPP